MRTHQNLAGNGGVPSGDIEPAEDGGQLMNAIHRIGLVIAGLATVVAVGGAFVIQGYVAAQQAVASAAPPAAAANVVTTPDPTASPSLDPQIVYVAPVPSPLTITVPGPAKPGKNTPNNTPNVPAATPPVIHVIVPTPVGEDDGVAGDN
jgi:hypothetical protein